MKKDHSALIANDDLCNYFSSSARANSLSHAYILLGAKGTGKHTLARIIASAVNCERRTDPESAVPCRSCSSCKRIMDGNSADVIIIGRDDKATVGVESIRFIKSDVSVYPNDGDFKVYIIEDAHLMTKQAQNALLLSLEEPPPYAMFILLCENTESILETIKSRAPILRMKAPTEEEAISYLKENHPSARSFIANSRDEFEQIYLASEGSIGRILELIGSAEKKQILQNRALALSLIDAVATHTLSSKFSDVLAMFAQKRDERDKLLDQLKDVQSALRDLLAIKKSESPKMIFFTDSSLAEELSYSFSARQIADIYEGAEKARQALLRNANVKLTVINFLSSMI